MKRVQLPAGLETVCFVLDHGALKAVPEVLQEYFPGRRPWIIADENTWKAAGKSVQSYLNEPCTPYIYPAEPVLHADYRHVPELALAMQENAVPIAVGGGTINDIVKRLAGEKQIPYLCVPTAPSVDGFTSAGASITKDGLKQTLKCPAPYVIVADVDVLQASPAEMKAAGYADLFAKLPAGAEWLIADTLGIEPVRQDVWDLIQPFLRDWLADAGNLDGIFAGLAATGYAMQLYLDSRPASGMEHLCSHVWEMEDVDASHGFKVSLGTVVSSFLLEKFFSLTLEELQKLMMPPKSRSEWEKEVDELLKKNIYGDAKSVAMAKFMEPDAILRRREVICANWETLNRRVREQLLPFDEIRATLKKAGCPVTPEELGLAPGQFIHGVRTAQLIRKRYTLLDVLEECGVMEYMMNELAKEFGE